MGASATMTRVPMQVGARPFQEYVAGFMIDGSGRVVLVEKRRGPPALIGKWNAVGGKVEPGESPFDAMRREWAEETGDEERRPWQRVCTVRGHGFRCHFYRVFVDRLPDLPGFNDSGEPLAVEHVNYPVSDEYHAPDLKWLMPLAASPVLPQFDGAPCSR